MKLHEIERKDGNSMELVAEQNKHNELKFLGSKKIIRGHKVFSMNTKTLVISEAKMVAKKEINWQDAEKGVVRSEVVIEPDCIYLSALNHKNARRKFFKLIIANNKR